MPESYALMKAGAANAPRTRFGATTPVDDWLSGRSFYGVRDMGKNVYVTL